MATCLLIDDEPLSRDVLRSYIEEVPDLEIVAECMNAVEATRHLSKSRIDILFLDINMPGLSGISFARSLTLSPLVIFTTAYPEYAVEGFELDATDYLVKPYSFERFLKAVNRALEKLRENHRSGDAEGKVLVRADKKLYALPFADILFIEGQGDYIRIHTPRHKLMVHDTLKNFLESLPSEGFMRIHKSYVVNLKQIEFIEGNQVFVAQQALPVSPAQRDDLLSRFASL